MVFSYLNKYVAKYSTLIVIMFSLVIQLAIIRQYIDNSVISSYAPEAKDAEDYAGRTNVWSESGFNAAFSDALRMPGYPFFIYVAEIIAPKYPYLFVRILQLVLVAISVGMLKVAVCRLLGLKYSIFLSLLYGVLPIWHFVPLLIAESLSSVVVAAIVLTLLFWKKSQFDLKSTVIAAILIAVATYLKPNHLILLPIVIVYLVSSSMRRKILTTTMITSLVGTLLLPWTLYVNLTHPRLIGLTATSGINFYIGTGMMIAYDGGVLARSAVRLGVDQNNNPDDVLVFKNNESAVEQSEKYTERAAEIWRDRTISQVQFGIAKIAFAFGFKSDSKVDSSFGFFNFLILLSGMVLLILKKHQAIALATLSTFFALGLQAFLFQADRRFVIPILLPFSVVCLGATLHALSKSSAKHLFSKIKTRLI